MPPLETGGEVSDLTFSADGKTLAAVTRNRHVDGLGRRLTVTALGTLRAWDS